MYRETYLQIKTNPRLLLTKLVEQLNDIMVWEKPNHRIQISYRYDCIVIYDTSFSSVDSRHIFLGSTSLEEAVEYLKLILMINYMNEVYYSTDERFSMVWNSDKCTMELFFGENLIAFGHSDVIKKTIQKRMCLILISDI